MESKKLVFYFIIFFFFDCKSIGMVADYDKLSKNSYSIEISGTHKLSKIEKKKNKRLSSTVKFSIRLSRDK